MTGTLTVLAGDRGTLTGEQLMREVGELIAERLPLVDRDDSYYAALSSLSLAAPKGGGA